MIEDTDSGCLERSKNVDKKRRISGWNSHMINEHETKEATPPVQGKIIIFVSLKYYLNCDKPSPMLHL